MKTLTQHIKDIKAVGLYLKVFNNKQIRIL